MNAVKIVTIMLYVLITTTTIGLFFIDDIAIENRVLRFEIIMWILVCILSKSNYEVDKYTNDTN